MSTYLALAEEGLVPRIDCPSDQGSLLCNIDQNDQIFLYCTSCSMKRQVGIESYEKLKNIVEAVIGKEM